jgi:Rrf2 family protein
MLKISSSVEYATRIMVRLSQLSADETVSAERLSGSERVPRDYVDQILQRLRRAGLVQSRRGALGGYRLAREAEAISVGDILHAVDDGVFESVCDKYADGSNQCAHTEGCSIRPVWRRLEVLVDDYLSKVSLTQLHETEDCVSSRVSALFEPASQ